MTQHNQTYTQVEDEILPPLVPIPGLEDGIEEDMARIRADIDAAGRKARHGERWYSRRCSCPRCLVIG